MKTFYNLFTGKVTTELEAFQEDMTQGYKDKDQRALFFITHGSPKVVVDLSELTTKELGEFLELIHKDFAFSNLYFYCKDVTNEDIKAATK